MRIPLLAISHHISHHTLMLLKWKNHKKRSERAESYIYSTTYVQYLHGVQQPIIKIEIHLLYQCIIERGQCAYSILCLPLIAGDVFPPSADSRLSTTHGHPDILNDGTILSENVLSSLSLSLVHGFQPGNFTLALFFSSAFSSVIH